MLTLTKTERFILPGQEKEEKPAAILYRRMLRREAIALKEILTPDDDGNVNFTFDMAYRVCAAVVVGFENIFDESGKVLEVERDEDGNAFESTFDLLDAKYVLAFSRVVMASSNLGEAEGGK